MPSFSLFMLPFVGWLSGNSVETLSFVDEVAYREIKRHIDKCPKKPTLDLPAPGSGKWEENTNNLKNLVINLNYVFKLHFGKQSKQKLKHASNFGSLIY